MLVDMYNNNITTYNLISMYVILLLLLLSIYITITIYYY